MLTYKVIIPETEQVSFLKFLDKIGAVYTLNEEQLELTEEQKKLLDQRLKQDKTKFVPAEEALNEMREKYGL